MGKKILMSKILDCTLRDGSYEVNFSFSSGDTALVCKGLEESGIGLIEIGHGVGLGASERTTQKAIQSDEEYMKAASSVLSKAKWGMFCIPGVASLDDIDRAADYGMGFIRIGTDVNKVETSKKFVERAKKHGMFVAANYMKSSAVTSFEFSRLVKLSESYGVECAYIVDSSGGMSFDEIKNTFYSIRDVSDIAVGFHGHNNLGLANGNSVSSVELGIEYIDSSLQGLGRSSGNAITESLVLALIKRGYDLKIDYMNLIKIGQTLIRPLIRRSGHRATDLIAGFADFHTSYMPHIFKVSAEYAVNPLVLMMEMSKIDKVDVTLDKLRSIAIGMEDNKNLYMGSYDPSSYIGGEQDF